MTANSRPRRRWWRRGTAKAPAPPQPTPRWDDVPTAGPTARPAAVLVELPAAVLDLTDLGEWGFGAGPIGLSGTAVLETLACAGKRLDDDIEFPAIMTSAIAAGIFAGDLDHQWNEADPDGHYDNTWLGAKFRTDGFVLNLLQGLAPHVDAVAGATTLSAMAIRLVAIPFLGRNRTTALLGPELGRIFEFVDVDPADSLPSLMTRLAGQLGLAPNEVSAITATRTMAQATMAAGVGTVWIDRVARTHSSSYDGRTGTTRNYRWSGSGPVPVIVDDFPAAIGFLAEVGDPRPSPDG